MIFPSFLHGEFKKWHIPKCFYCKNSIPRGKTVLRVCSCENNMCSSCAIRMLMENEKTFMSQATCPQCQECHPYRMIEGREKALLAEDEIIVKAMFCCYMNPNACCELEGLQRCWQFLLQPQTCNTTTLTLSEQQIRRKITLLMLKKDSTLLDPIKYIKFKKDENLEDHLSICILCKQRKPHSDNVTLNCSCTYCSKCILIHVLSKKEAFKSVFNCPNCSKVTENIIKNPTHMEACVSALIKSAVKYWTPTLIPSYDNKEIKCNLVQIIKLYHIFGYIGLPFASSDSTTTTISSSLNNLPKQCIRIIIAICEEIRLNYLHYGIKNTIVEWKEHCIGTWMFRTCMQQGDINTGIDEDLNIQKLKFLGTVNITKYIPFYTDMNHLLPVEKQNQAESNILHKINTIINNTTIKMNLTAVDKIIIIALLQNKNSADNNWSKWYMSTVSDIYPAIVAYVQSTAYMKYASFIKKVLVLKLNKLVLLQIATKSNGLLRIRNIFQDQPTLLDPGLNKSHTSPPISGSPASSSSATAAAIGYRPNSSNTGTGSSQATPPDSSFSATAAAKGYRPNSSSNSGVVEFGYNKSSISSSTAADLGPVLAQYSQHRVPDVATTNTEAMEPAEKLLGKRKAQGLPLPTLPTAVTNVTSSGHAVSYENHTTTNAPTTTTTAKSTGTITDAHINAALTAVYAALISTPNRINPATAATVTTADTSTHRQINAATVSTADTSTHNPVNAATVATVTTADTSTHNPVNAATAATVTTADTSTHNPVNAATATAVDRTGTITHNPVNAATAATVTTADTSTHNPVNAATNEAINRVAASINAKLAAARVDPSGVSLQSPVLNRRAVTQKPNTTKHPAVVDLTLDED